MHDHARQDSLTERSKALAPGTSPQGRGFEPHSCQAPESEDPRQSARPLGYKWQSLRIAILNVCLRHVAADAACPAALPPRSHTDNSHGIASAAAWRFGAHGTRSRRLPWIKDKRTVSLSTASAVMALHGGARAAYSPLAEWAAVLPPGASEMRNISRVRFQVDRTIRTHGCT